MRSGLGGPEAITPRFVWIYELDACPVWHRLQIIEPWLIADQVMLMMMVVHVSPHLRGLRRGVPAFSPLLFGYAAGTHRAGGHRACMRGADMLRAIGSHRRASRTGRCAASA